MAGRITIDVGLNTRDVTKGAKDGERALENLEDAVRDAGSGGAKGLEKLEDELKDVQRQSERTDRSLDDVGGTTKRSFGQASENVRNFKSEAVQNLSEVASSWEGDIEGMADGVQGLTGGLAAALTPGVGIPVAVLGAAAAAFFTSWQKAAEESEQRVEEMYGAMTEAGVTFLNDKFINDKIIELAGSQDTYNQAVQRGKDLGVETQDVLRAMAGDQEKINELMGPRNQALQDEIDKIKESGESIETQQVNIEAATTKFSEQYGWLVKLVEEHGNAAERAWDANQAIRSANGEMDRLAAKWASIPKSTQLGITVNTAEFDRQFNLLAQKANKGITVVLKPGQGRGWE